MLFIYDFEFNLLLTEPDIMKSRWLIYYNDVGTFEAHLPVTSELIKIINDNKYLVVCQRGLSAIVVGYEISNELVLYGRTCNWLLSKRITPKFEKKTVFLGDAAAAFVKVTTSSLSAITGDCSSVSNLITRSTRTAVLPEPAAAETIILPFSFIASACSFVGLNATVLTSF